MQVNPIFYKEIIPLDRNRHGGLFLAPRTDFQYAKTTNSVFLAAVEFGRAFREYPIVFGDDGNVVFPLAILGLRDGENLFVNQDGSWGASYVPAYVRRYPFILSAQPDSDTLTVCIDQSYANLNSEHKGKALFEDGRESDLLKSSLEFLKDFQTQYTITSQFGGKLKELGILESMQANIQLNNGSKLNMGGFLVVNRQRLLELTAEQLAAMARDGSLELIYLHLNSMDNFSRLVERLSSRPVKTLADTPTVGNA
jgi:hypothetical protein